MTRAAHMRTLLAEGWPPKAVAIKFGVSSWIVRRTAQQRPPTPARPHLPQPGVSADIRAGLAAGRITLATAARRAGLSVAELKRRLYG